MVGYSGHGTRKNPTGTDTTVGRYGQRLRGGWEGVLSEMTAAVEQRDVFGLEGTATPLAEGEPTVPDTEEVPTSDDPSDVPESVGIGGFIAWLKQAIDTSVLGVVDRQDNPFIRAAYIRGVVDIRRVMKGKGAEIADDAPLPGSTASGGRDSHGLAANAYADLEEMRDDTADRVRRQLKDLLNPDDGKLRPIGGLEPDSLATEIREQIEKEGVYRSNLIAESGPVEAHSEGVLNEVERVYGPEAEVRIRAEWLTAQDSNVCPICASLSGSTYTVRQVREGTFTYQAAADERDSLTGQYPLQPPAHPRCRCAIVISAIPALDSGETAARQAA